MTPKLIEQDKGGKPEREILIEGQEFLIGRGTDCNLRLAVSEISRHHCLLRFRGQEASLADLGSSNGTFVNGKRVRSQAVLHSGDEIRLGAYCFVLHMGDAADPNKAGGADPAASTLKIKTGQAADGAQPGNAPGAQ